MDFIEGETFFDLKRSPDADERLIIFENAARIHALDCRPPYLFDSWAIPNARIAFNNVKEFIAPDDLKSIESVLSAYEEISIEDLPHSFVHGDLTKANVLRSLNGRIYFLDFSVSNWYPRIQELAVINANLLHDKASLFSLREKCERSIDEYCAFEQLNSLEVKSLYPFALTAVAMEFMGACQERYLRGNDTDESRYWHDLGRHQLREAFSKH